MAFFWSAWKEEKSSTVKGLKMEVFSSNTSTLSSSISWERMAAWGRVMRTVLPSTSTVAWDKSTPALMVPS